MLKTWCRRPYCGRGGHCTRTGWAQTQEAWLLRILRNVHIDRLRVAYRAARTTAETQGHNRVPVAHETPESLFMARLVDVEVRQALMQIPEVYRVCVILADLEGASYTKIMDALAIPRDGDEPAVPGPPGNAPSTHGVRSRARISEGELDMPPSYRQCRRNPGSVFRGGPFVPVVFRPFGGIVPTTDMPVCS